MDKHTDFEAPPVGLLHESGRPLSFHHAVQVALSAVAAVKLLAESQKSLLEQIGSVPPGSVDRLLQVYEYIYLVTRHLHFRNNLTILSQTLVTITTAYFHAIQPVWKANQGAVANVVAGLVEGQDV